MPAVKVAISIEKELLAQVDELVAKMDFASRSYVIETAVREKINRLNHCRLADACAKLDPQFHKTLAEEGISDELDRWPEY